MATIKSKDDLTGIFNHYAKGADRPIGPDKQLSTEPTTPPTHKLDTFTGTLFLDGDQLRLRLQGGGVFAVKLAMPIPDIAPYMGKEIFVYGKQDGATITGATFSLRHSGVAVSRRPVTLKQKTEVKKLAAATREFLKEYKESKGIILTARPGYKFEKGVITKVRAIVAVVERKKYIASVDRGEMLPSTYEGYDVEVVSASPLDLLRYTATKEVAASINVASSLLEAAVKPQSSTEAAEVLEATVPNYIPPTDVQLDEITDAMTIICHVSPESGWNALEPFLLGTEEHLQIGMYDFSAKHIVTSLQTVLHNGASMKLVYDGNPAAGVGKGTKVKDREEDSILRGLRRIGGRNFEQIKAWKGKSGICANAYHIKVAVKDEEAFWLSSGNWQSSNQPNVDFFTNNKQLAKYNREWNLIVRNKKLARIYHKFLDWDFERSSQKPEEEAAALALLPEYYLEAAELEAGGVDKYTVYRPKEFVFTKNKPLRAQPILSPDNFIEHAKELIQSAQKTLYFQNQYIKLTESITSEYQDLLTALMKKVNDDKIDVKIILRAQHTDDDRKMLEDLQEFGFEMSRIRLMRNTHTKGIIADGKRVMVGSHNWSNAGVQYNRDASLLIYHAGIAQYYQDIFLHDWERRTNKTHEEKAILKIDGGITEAQSFADDLEPLNWTEYLE